MDNRLEKTLKLGDAENFKFGDDDRIVSLIKDPTVDLTYNDNEITRRALVCRQVNTMKLLLSPEFKDRTDPSIWGGKALKSAVDMGHISIVKMLLENKRIVFTETCELLVSSALAGDHPDMAELLLKDERTKFETQNRDDSLLFASMSGYTNIVELLLKDPRFDLTQHYDFICFFKAWQNDHHGIVKLFLNDSRINPDGLTEEEYLVKRRDGFVGYPRRRIIGGRILPLDEGRSILVSGRIDI